MTATIDVQLLQPQTTKIIRRNDAGQELIEIMYQGEPIARVTLEHVFPSVSAATKVEAETETWAEQAEKIWPGLTQLTADIGAHWPEGVSALDAIHDVHYEQVTVEQMQQVVANLSKLSAEISQQWPEGASALDAIHDIRRE